MQLAQFKDLPFGPYQLAAEATGEGRRPHTCRVRKAFLFISPAARRYRPGELGEFLGNRNKVLVDLGFKRETVMIPWHSVDSHPGG